VYVDAARKVVGVGSVGTRCFIVLLASKANQDPLFLQVKEAWPSVLSPTWGRSGYANQGQRVVAGQRLLQSASDIFLGWSKVGPRDFYVRQLRDWKASPEPETMDLASLLVFAQLCGAKLAMAHARTAHPAQIEGYCGNSDTLDKAIASFAVAYADQTERDHAAMVEAARSGRIEVIEGR
jgi:uncharacterized protein (DUF2252 family)